MTDLTPEAAALFKEARSKHDPSDADCGRVLGALHARLGIPEALASATLLETASPAIASTKATTTGALLGAKATKLVLATVVLGGSVSATLLGSAPPKARDMPRVVSAPIVVTSSIDRPDAASVQEPEPAPVTTHALLPRPKHVRHGRSQTRARVHAAPPLDASTPQPELPSEVALIRRALTSLRDRDPHAALSLLETHAAHYPNGLFKKEREGARVLALCAAGHTQEGRAEKARFLASAGSSPIAARVQLACRDE